MFKTRKSRAILAISLFTTLYIIVGGLVGYFFGFDEIDEWSGFWVGIFLTSGAMVFIGLAGIVTIAIISWVYRGKSEDDR